MKTSLSGESLQALTTRLSEANRAFARGYPGETGRRQPVHTMYGGAHLFRSDTARRLGDRARRELALQAPDFAVFAKALGLPGSIRLPSFAEQAARLEASVKQDPEAVRRENKPAWLAYTVYARVQEKLAREPVEDYRIDFEDGYGRRSGVEEDGHAEGAAQAAAAAMASGDLPPFFGIRIKPLVEELRDRSIRTLDLFLTTLLEATGGKLPGNFVVTLPKVTIPEQVAVLADLLDLLEARLRLGPQSLKLEIMIERPQAILNQRGECHVLPLIEAARGRAVAAHFGTYDYTAGCGITAAHQHMLHSACNFARHMMQVALAGTGIWLSDGGTNVLPVPIHPDGEGASGRVRQRHADENRAAIHRAWKLHWEHIQHSLANGFYQGWDLHPAQLPSRYAAVYSFFLDGLETASARLRNFISNAAQATLMGDVFDDAATGQGLLNYFLRAMHCGAITESEAVAFSGMSLQELKSGSFVQILKTRQASA